MSKTIEGIKELPKPLVADFIIKHGVGILAADGRYYHFSEVITLIKRFSQSQTQELQEQNAELVEMLERVNRKSEIYEDGLREELEELLTKYKKP